MGLERNGRGYTYADSSSRIPFSPFFPMRPRWPERGRFFVWGFTDEEYCPGKRFLRRPPGAFPGLWQIPALWSERPVYAGSWIGKRWSIAHSDKSLFPQCPSGSGAYQHLEHWSILLTSKLCRNRANTPCLWKAEQEKFAGQGIPAQAATSIPGARSLGRRCVSEINAPRASP